MSGKDLADMQAIELNKALKYVHEYLKNPRKPLAQVLYPEIPWNKNETRVFLSPKYVQPWVALPFYEKPIIPLLPTQTEKEFKAEYGIGYEDLLVLWRKRIAYPLIWTGYPEAHEVKSEYLMKILERNPPCSRELHYFLRLMTRRTLEQCKKDFLRMGESSKGRFEYLFLCAAGFRDRVLDGYKKILSLEDGKLREAYRDRWLFDLYNFLLVAPTLDSVPLIEHIKYQIIHWPLGPCETNPRQATITEVAQELLTVWNLTAPADPTRLDVDLIIATHRNARDFRRAYVEFQDLVQAYKIREGFESFQEAVGPLVEEYNKSAPYLDVVDKIMLGSVTVGAASLTTVALASIVKPEVLALLPGGPTIMSELGVLRSKIAKEWIRSKYAGLLSKIGRGPFRFAHTWRAHGIVRKAKQL